MRPHNVAYYASHRAEEIERVTARQRATISWLRELRDVPCFDCGRRFPPHVMDFDHRVPSLKKFALTCSRALLKSREELLLEIAKCDVVCANCHAIRTALAYQNGTLEFGFKPAPTPNPNPTAQGRRERFLRHKAAQNALLDRIRTLPCHDCGQTFPICVMEFDHRDASQKRAMLSVMAGRVRIGTLLEEIAKCDIVCSNCHRERTFRRRSIGGSSTMEMRLPSKQVTRVRFPSPAQTIEQPRLIEESLTPYRVAA